MKKIYTKKGDLGETSLVHGTRVAKNHPIVEAYGTVDELNATIGMSISEMEKDVKKYSQSIEILSRIQSELFEIESFLATEAQYWDITEVKAIVSSFVLQLEREIDVMEQELSPLTNFILPRGSQLITFLHLNRTVCRRAERKTIAILPQFHGYKICVQYLNRLSDFFFILIRFFHKTDKIPEFNWKSSR